MDNEDKKSEPEIIPPKPDSDDSGSTEDYKNLILANISNYTDRPDLLIAEIEKHDPGIIKRLNLEAENTNKKYSAGRYNFGRFQAYLSAIIIAIIAIAIVFCLIWMFVFGEPDFWPIIALAVFFAVAMSGTDGFTKISDGIAKAVNKSKPD